MKQKTSEEFDRFDTAMEGLLAVPYKELQQKLAEEKKAKAALPKRPRQRSTNHKKAQ